MENFNRYLNIPPSKYLGMPMLPVECPAPEAQPMEWPMRVTGRWPTVCLEKMVSKMTRMTGRCCMAQLFMYVHLPIVWSGWMMWLCSISLKLIQNMQDLMPTGRIKFKLMAHPSVVSQLHCLTSVFGCPRASPFLQKLSIRTPKASRKFPGLSARTWAKHLPPMRARSTHTSLEAETNLFCSWDLIGFVWVSSSFGVLGRELDGFALTESSSAGEGQHSEPCHALSRLAMEDTIHTGQATVRAWSNQFWREWLELRGLVATQSPPAKESN